MPIPPGVFVNAVGSYYQRLNSRADAAGAVLAVHAEVVDTLAIRSALGEATDYYSICALVQALGRLPETGPFPELDQVYVRSAYSYARARAVEAMAATDPAFDEKWATECLWDCEESARTLGAECAPATAFVAARLDEMAADIHEIPEVREASRLRLGRESRSTK